VTLPAYPVDRVTPLHGPDLLPYLSVAIDSAAVRVWAVVFHIDVRLHNDPDFHVRRFLKRLAVARWRNVDVRIVVSGATAEDIHVGNHTSALYLASLGIETRFFTSRFQTSTHSKTVVVDDRLAIIGSHNWSHRAFRESLETSMAIESGDVVETLAGDFESVWESSAEGAVR
jgi:phosphatidylserine/phosphatidylglycerophosphate/cardiolipin synthase-like enzyme